MTALLRSAFEAEGIVFVEDSGSGPGVCFKVAKKPASASGHPRPNGPATDVVERMEAEIAADRGKRKP